MNSKELREKRSKLLADAQALSAGELNAENRSKIDAMLADAKSLAAVIEVAEAEERSAAETRGKNLQLPNVGEHTEVKADEKAVENFRHYLKTGEVRDLTVSADGVLIPTLVSQPVIAKKSAGQIYDVVGKIVTATGAPINVPLLNDTANSFVLNSVGATTTDPTVSSVQLKVDDYRSNPILLENSLIQDAAFDLEGFVVQSIYERYQRDASKFMTLGNSSNITGLTSISTGITSKTTDALDYTDFVGMVAALDPAYAGSAVWTMSNATLGKVLQLVDGNGRPIFLPFLAGTNEGFVGQILGYPVKINQYLPAVATGNVAVQFGDFKAGYMFRETSAGIMVKRLAERYAELNKVGYVAFTRMGGVVTDAGTHPVLSLTIK
jgi:HK97 family phage major capsid protein